MGVNVESTGNIRYAYDILVSNPYKRTLARQYGRRRGTKEISCEQQSQALASANGRLLLSG